MKGADDIERNAFQQWIAELTTAAEKWAKVPYDVVSPKDGLTPNVHRLASLGHDPLLGLVFGVGDILSGTGEPGLPDKLKREQMLVLTHGLLASANILKTALYGWNPMAINLAQFQTLTKRMLSLVKLASERDRMVGQALDDRWEALLDSQSRFPAPPVRDPKVRARISPE
ncbi:MAG: hypothetical protein OXL34_13845 [Gemmatimonadota bacterium]|nr:hypothetical protein [Gemmatimonadota bacterium]